MKNQDYIDLRSDTVTLPTQEMLEAIRNAELGDDVFREDPTVNRLEEKAAEKMGKEAALLVSSGTQANLVSLMANTEPGELVILESQSHIYWYEVGGVSRIAGLLPWPVESLKGALNPKDVEAAIRPKNIHFPKPTLICVENTHNRHGGTIVTPSQINALREVAKTHDLKIYLDGARIFNAAVALEVDVKEIAKDVDNLMFCLSKSLSCPVGSVVVGTQVFIEKARKARKVLGGGMRQAGIIAASGIVALEKMIDRLKEDHENAKHLAQALNRMDGLSVDLENLQTNILLLDIGDLGISAKQFISELKENGVLALDQMPNKIRMVTHRGITRTHIEETKRTIENIAQRRN
ncbi:aminotransferase class I/II-fold pyridoxal phosphate-dependent enzyme [Candidatus Bathyarchaeota archaeon]|nr:aminotransferase class I/II-fold pyridoxal phosphate-dependent enzyme [Candidatus Bathyarchaeota archaeon]